MIFGRPEALLGTRISTGPAVVLLGIVTLLVGLPSAATEPELITDRPDQTESSDTVARGYVQVELGYTHSEGDEAGAEVQTDSVPETLVRIGLHDAVELRVGLGGYQDVKIGSGPSASSVDGLADSSLGVKVGLLEGDGKAPKTALLATISLPTGDSDLTSDQVDPSFRLTFANDLTERLSLGYNVGAAWSTTNDGSGDEDTLSVAEWTVALGIGATDKLGFFVEAYGATGLSAGGGPDNWLDGGVTWLLRPNVQLDAAVGQSLTNSDDWFAGLGISFRLPR